MKCGRVRFKCEMWVQNVYEQSQELQRDNSARNQYCSRFSYRLMQRSTWGLQGPADVDHSVQERTRRSKTLSSFIFSTPSLYYTYPPPLRSPAFMQACKGPYAFPRLPCKCTRRPPPQAKPRRKPKGRDDGILQSQTPPRSLNSKNPCN